MKVKRRRQKAANRAQWASAVKEAKAIRGPKGQGVSTQAYTESCHEDIFVILVCGGNVKYSYVLQEASREDSTCKYYVTCVYTGEKQIKVQLGEIR
jgi:hypothetical protein